MLRFSESIEIIEFFRLQGGSSGVPKEGGYSLGLGGVLRRSNIGFEGFEEARAPKRRRYPSNYSKLPRVGTRDSGVCSNRTNRGAGARVVLLTENYLPVMNICNERAKTPREIKILLIKFTIDVLRTPVENKGGNTISPFIFHEG